MEVPCSRRLARESGLDSFNPNVWTAFKQCTLGEPSLEEAPNNKLETIEEITMNLGLTAWWACILRDHRAICWRCNTAGYEHFKGNLKRICFFVCVNFGGRRDFCWLCTKKNLGNYVRFKHMEVAVGESEGPWTFQAYHLKCAEALGIITAKELRAQKENIDTDLDIAKFKYKQCLLMRQRDDFQKRLSTMEISKKL
jgi:hypothetical protein